MFFKTLVLQTPKNSFSGKGLNLLDQESGLGELCDDR